MNGSRMRVLIVDDEALSRRGLALRLARHADIELLGECSNGREAVASINTLNPDLVFLDIQMPGLNGFDVLGELSAQRQPLVVFVTAYNQHAIRAFEARAIDYLLKPVDDDRLEAALDHARQQFAQRAATRERRYPQMLPVRQGRETLRVQVDAIDWIDAAGDYMCLHCAGATHVMRATMKELEDLLDPRVFQRVHRSTIVNLARVRSLRSHTNGEYFLTLADGHELKLSRSFRDKVERYLKSPVPGA